MKKGLLLFAHGARDSRWAIPFEDIAQRVRQAAPAVPVRLCFLEFMQPGLAEGGDALALEGCEHVDVVPLFLGAGGHVRKDIPQLLAGLETKHPQVRWELRPAIGEMETVMQAMADASLAWLAHS